MKYTIERNLVGAAVVRSLFHVSSETLRRWRRDLALPHVVIMGNGNPIIVYNWVHVIRWAAKNRIPIREDVARDMLESEERRWKTSKDLTSKT